MKDITSYWIDISDYDFETAIAMQRSGRYLYVGFMCHQTIEKILKAHYYTVKNETPPYTHSLSRIAELSGLLDEFSEEFLQIMDVLELLNIEARYPSYKEKLMKSLTEGRCKKILEDTEKLRTWIKAKL